ncbi:hypothetical protein [Leptotrichia sp. oral taxon 212]|uniref:hypothetical protein n=1 Tax=Leptotrichia sp. oral taxon 212 TaxID=712357 RepID=UPI000B15BA00|nr:hypothetical protein [Leptotrichia sp. oral taxon 212]
MKNKGETLVESLLSIFFVAVVLPPVSNLILKTFRTDSKIDRKNIFNMETENISEILKTKDYAFLYSHIGKYVIQNKNDFYSKFAIEGKYQILKDTATVGKRELEIKATENYYLNEKGEKEHILEITIDRKKDYYFPEIK